MAKKTATKKPAADGPEARDYAVHATVMDTPGTTAADIAAGLGLGKSTVVKALARLESAGQVTRSKGGHDGKKRLPDTFEVAGKKRAAKTTPKKANGKPNGKRRPTLTIPDAGVKLGKGELGALVADYLTANRDGEYGPSQIAKVVNRSAGAIANALDKMEAEGKVTLTADKPRRYRISG